MSSTPKATVTGLLRHLANEDANADFYAYMSQRWFESGRMSYAEKLFGELCDRKPPLAIWGKDGLLESEITAEGREHLRKLQLKIKLTRAQKAWLERLRPKPLIVTAPGSRATIDVLVEHGFLEQFLTHTYRVTNAGRAWLDQEKTT